MSEEQQNEHFAKLKKQADQLPTSPGVYIMKDAEDEIIYVGKALNLRARVRTYFRGGDGRRQIQYLLRRVHKLEKIITESEEQALILERDIINKNKPRYNIRLKDDKSYISIRIDRNAQWPRLEWVRKVANDGALYFGPYAESGKVRELLEVIKNVIPLRTCSNTVFYNRQRPCLEYQIKRCAGPCCLPVSRQDYDTWIEQAIALLQGKNDKAIKNMNERMNAASQDLRFEEAAILRDRIAIIEEYSKGQHRSYHRAESRDCFAIYRESALVCLYVLKVRNGRMADSDCFTFSEVLISDQELLEETLTQYYSGQREIPQEILLPLEPNGSDFIRKFLRQRAGQAVDVLVPQRGSKARLVRLAEVNAEHGFKAKFLGDERYAKVSQRLAEICGLKQVPRRIECVDISNLQGSNIVGALVSFFDGSPDKQRYRKYKISFQDKPDDFAAINEVVMRRLLRGKEEGNLPDLLIIDGGANQLKKALEARDELALSLNVIALAKMRSEFETSPKQDEKKPERIFIEGRTDSIALDSADELTHLLQRIRDEVHRFVITFHRASRAKRVFRSALDDIAGVGPERRARLLRHFGSVNAIKNSEPGELAKVGRMPLSLALKIKAIL